jgi:AdoMet-dependent heme synthase
VRKVWESSPVFEAIRDLKGYKGRCGRFRHVRICGGCRARARELKGDFLEEEPYCSYNPAASNQPSAVSSEQSGNQG